MNLMSDSILQIYRAALKDPSNPPNRIIRKTLPLTFILILARAYYYHIYLDKYSVSSILGTLLSSFVILFIVAIVGGYAVGGLYEAFLIKVKAEDSKDSWPTFFVEWMLAMYAPILGAVIVAVLMAYLTIASSHAS